ncbi:MAG: site-2 protease family protein [Christensenellales bacterium]
MKPDIFFAARLMKIPVREFAIGFGPKLFQWKRKKHETEFFLRAIPLGGYCAFYGEDDTKKEFENDPRAFNNYSVSKRLLTIIMGPLMNLVLALVAAVVLFALSGIPVPEGPVKNLGGVRLTRQCGPGGRSVSRRYYPGS